MRRGTGTFYRLTPEGTALWSRRDTAALPEHHRVILGLLEFSGHREVLRARLARYPDRAVDGWLRELQARNLIEATTAEPPDLSALVMEAAPVPANGEKERISADARFAGISLSRLGVYVDHDRVANRPPSWKAPSFTVALVIEDDPDQLALAVLRLTNAGYRVQTGDSVKALLDSLQKRAPDALFLDVALPDGDGFDVLAALRQHPGYARLPVIMVTAKADPEDIARGLSLGADAYVTKPYGRNTLDYALRYVLQQELSGAALPAAPRQEKKRPLPQGVPETREDVRALLAELALRREGEEARAAARWRAVKRTALTVGLVMAVLQYYMMDTLREIVSLRQMPVFISVTARDLRSALEPGAVPG